MILDKTRVGTLESNVISRDKKHLYFYSTLHTNKFLTLLK